jgi:[protein-PII] uridylyltransferase
VTPAFRRDPVVQQMFLDILKHRGVVAPILRQMHEARFLGAFLPAFGRITAQVQHEFFHQYTADEHTLMCLEHLDDFGKETTPAFRPYADMFRRLERPELLYLALLLHDTGKGDGPDHTTSGARIAAAVARRLQLDPPAARRIEFLVRHHLDMVSVSQKRNLADPHVIGTFAAVVGDLENLRALTLLTVADSLGTSDKLWTPFKDALLLTLFHRTQEHLQGQAVLAGESGRSRLRAGIAGRAPPGLEPDEIEAHFAHLPASYFQHAEVGDVITDLEVAHAFLRAQVLGEGHPLAPIIRCQALAERGCAVVRCCTWDRHGLFAKLTGAFTAAQVNILSADIYTRGDGLVLDTFHVADPTHPAPPDDRALERFSTLARQALTGELDLADVLRRPPAALTLPGVVTGGERLRTTVVLDQQSSPHHTIIEVDAEDRLGLLYTITTVLAELGVDIRFARINTANGVASDAFYVVETGGGPIRHPARQKQVRTALLGAIGRL